jgi:hypothetical protein
MKDDMKKTLLLLLALFLAASAVFAALNGKPRSAKEMTVEELADGITKVLDQTEEVMDFVPGFKKDKDPAGGVFYTYKGARLEKMEKDILAALYVRVRQERTRLNTERITKQLETIRNVQRATAITNQVSRPPAVVTPPATPPQPVTVPKAPPAPPPSTRR